MRGETCRLVLKGSGNQSEHYYPVHTMGALRQFLATLGCKGPTTLPRQFGIEYLLTQDSVSGTFLNGQTLYLKTENTHRTPKS